MQRNQKGRFCRKVTEGFKGYFFKANKIFCKVTGYRGKYYKLGATYNKRKGTKPKPCTGTGYHFCTDPAGVWNFYPPFKLSVYTKVTLPEGAQYSETETGDKSISTSLKIGEKLYGYLEYAREFFHKIKPKIFNMNAVTVLKVSSTENTFTEAFSRDSIVGIADRQCLKGEHGVIAYLGDLGAAYSYDGFTLATSTFSLAQSCHGIALANGTAVSNCIAFGLCRAIAKGDGYSNGIAIGGRNTAFMGEQKGALFICLYDSGTQSPKCAVARVGENGIEPQTYYQFDGIHWKKQD